MSNNDADTPAGCTHCGAPTGDAATLCRTCTFKLEADLREIPAYLWAELDTTITRQDKLLPTAERPSGGEKPLAWNEHAAQVRWELASTLNAWCLDVAGVAEDGRDRLADIPQHAVPELAEWLIRNMPTLRQHPEAGQAYEELTDAIRRARKCIDRPETRTRFKVGPCPEQADEGACDGEVWAYIPTTEDKVSHMRCLACDAHWDTTQWLRVGRRMLTRIHQLRTA